MKKRHFYLLVLLVSLISLGFSLFRITPFTFDNGTYIGIITTLIGISVTLLIGYQIINSFEIRKEISEMRKTIEDFKKIKDEIVDTQTKISKMEFEVQESLDIISAKFASFEQSKCVVAFLILQKALTSSLKAERKEFGYIFSELKEYIKKIQPGYFATGQRVEVDERILKYLNNADKSDLEIKSLENYCSIKYEYERIMQLFQNRMENSRNNITVTEEEYRELAR